MNNSGLVRHALRQDMLFLPLALLLVSLGLPGCDPQDGGGGAASTLIDDLGALDGTAQDGTAQAEDGTAQAEDGTAQAEDGTAQAEDGTAQAEDGAVAGLSVWQQDLVFLREEEKLARDVYLTLYGKWSLNPHKNIAKAEQTHTDRVKALLLQFQIPDPVKDDTVGVFEAPVLAKLYTDLVALGSKSETDALVVGATIEDLDIHDIDEMQKHTTDPVLKEMYDALTCGSRNHMRAFHSQLKSRGVTYTAQYITSVALTAIVTTPNVSCGGGK